MNAFVLKKVTFLSWFLFVTAIAVGVFYTWRVGILKPMLTIDGTHVTWVIASIAILTSFVIGVLSFRLNEETVSYIELHSLWHMVYAPGVLFALGIVGSTMGFYLQANALTSGAASMSALGTGIIPTCFAAMSVVFVLIQSFGLHYSADRLSYRLGH